MPASADNWDAGVRRAQRELAMNPEDAEEYTASLGQIGGGLWRQILWAQRQDIPAALGLTTQQWVDERLGGYVKLEAEKRKPISGQLTAPIEEGGEGLSNVAAAAVLGVGEATIRRDLASPNDEDDQQAAPECGPPGGTASSNDEDDLPAGEPTIEPLPVNDGDEWYTPRWLFDALGVSFDLDVCAPIDPTHTAVPARRSFTKAGDGLAQPWQGIVWCNPPYSSPEPWARRMIHHGNGLLLTHVPINAGWCVDMWEACAAMRLFQAMEFVRPDGTSQRPGYWLQLASFGEPATDALLRLQPLGSAAGNKRRVASPIWVRANGGNRLAS